jgi:hypothetical protein
MSKSLNPSTIDSKYVDFQSSEFYNHLFKIKKSGIFTFDGRKSNISCNELAYCVKASKVVFCPYISDSQLTEILGCFCGHKLVICGGFISERGMDAIIRFLIDSHIEEGVVLHINNVEIDQNQLKKFVFRFKVNAFVRLRELSVDYTSFKMLELLSLLEAFSLNSSVERLFVNFEGHQQLVKIVSPVFKLLKTNTALEEVNILGAYLDSTAIEGICYSCLRGLPSLKYVKLLCSPTISAQQSAESFVTVCKERIKFGKGLSVVFDVADEL